MFLSASVRWKKEGGKKKFDSIQIEAVPAYNPRKPFHPKDTGRVGWLVTSGGITVYHAGDTDVIPEMMELSGRVDIALLPVGGTYTMSEPEAAEAVRMINPKVVIPMHYGYIEGTQGDPEKFKACVGVSSEVVILEPQI